MLLEKAQQFLLEGFPPVVFLVVLDVSNRGVDLGHANAERPVALLPGEMDHVGKGLMQPFGRIAFDQLDGLRDRQG